MSVRVKPCKWFCIENLDINSFSISLLRSKKVVKPTRSGNLGENQPTSSYFYLSYTGTYIRHCSNTYGLLSGNGCAYFFKGRSIFVLAVTASILLRE
jgi:hypothetical protein